MEAIVAKIAVNVIRFPGKSANELPPILRNWFGEDAGLPGRRDAVRFRKGVNTIIMEPFSTDIKRTSGLKLWERYAREAIPPAFGLAFNPAIWNVGFVVSQTNIVLLVTLTKDDMNPDHRYSDHFLSDLEFNWQSQNRTTQESKHGQMIRDHRAEGIHVHLFVRPTEKKPVKNPPRLHIAAKSTLFLGKATARSLSDGGLRRRSRNRNGQF